jgi:hypothetical protein
MDWTWLKPLLRLCHLSSFHVVSQWQCETACLPILHRIWQMGSACSNSARSFKQRIATSRLVPATLKEFALRELKICATSLLDKPSRKFLKPQSSWNREKPRNLCWTWILCILA